MFVGIPYRMVKKFIVLGIALLTMAAFSINAFAASQAYPWVQSKTNWCWATVAKAMIDTRSGISVPSSYVQKNNQTGIRKDYCLKQNEIFITDKAQEYIVWTYKEKGTSFTGDNKDNLPGSSAEIINAVSAMTSKSLASYGTWNTTPFSNSNIRATYIDDRLVTDSKEICGNAYSHGATEKESKGHSLLITQKNSDGSYKTWNPWTNSYTTYTASAMFSSGFYPAPFTSVKMYVENAVYFTS